VGTPDLPLCILPSLGRFPYSLVPRGHHLPLGEFGCATPWSETSILGQVRTARRRYCASESEALCMLLSHLAMPSRVEDLEKHFVAQKEPLPRYFTKHWRVFCDGMAHWYLRSKQTSVKAKFSTILVRFLPKPRIQRRVASGSSTELSLRLQDRVECCKERRTVDTRDF
jgi:hypothetical protein